MLIFRTFIQTINEFAFFVIKGIARKHYFNFAEFTLTEKDAKEYKYSKSTKQRVHKWKDIKVKLYI